jgi:hypothetical protein
MAEWVPIEYGYVTISLIAIVLNSIVIYLFLTRKCLRNMYSNIFLFSLAISDLSYAAVAIPLLIKCEHLARDGHAPPQKVCYAYAYVMVFFGYSTVYHIVLAIAEKLCAICFALKHHAVFCRSIAIKLSLFVWILSIFFTHIPVWWEYFFPDAEKEVARIKAYIKFHFVTGYAIPVLTSAIMYSVILHKIFKAVSQRLTEDTQRKAARLHAEKKAVLTFAIMLAAFLFAWSTWFLARIQVPMAEGVPMYQFITISKLLDPILNPLLYTFLKHDFRRDFLRLFWSKRRRRQSQTMHLTRLNNRASATSATREDMMHSPRACSVMKHTELSKKGDNHEQHDCGVENC